MKKILLTGGGTAGHCVPNLALIPNLYEYFDKISYIGSNGIEKTLLEPFKDVDYHTIDCVKLERKFTFKNFKIPFKLISSINQAKKIIKNISPDIIFSKGGYVSLPVVIAGAKLGIPCVTHESDLSMGLANKLIAKKCNFVFTSFEQTAKTLPNGVYTGSPIKNNLFLCDKKQGLEFFNFSGRKPILLITGGSQGSNAINEVTLNALQELGNTFDIIHLTGKGKSTNFKADFYRQYEFLSQMEKAFSACDLVVSRGGSNALFELIALQKPSLIIPLPKNNSRGDQILNAKYFSEKNLCKMLLQENLTKSSFVYNVNLLLKECNFYKKKLNEYPIKSGNEKICELLYKISR